MKLLLDTNVWLDFFLDRSVRHGQAGLLVAQSNRADATLFVSANSVRDIYYQIGQELKRMEREAHGEVNDSFANAINEATWSCVTSLRKQAIVVGSDGADLVEALAMKSRHSDLEDNCIAAAFKRARADYLVTSDKKLLKHQLVPTISIEEALDRLPSA